MLAPHAVDIAVIISSLIASLCFTFAEPFDDIFLIVKSSCALVSGNTNKSLRPKEGRSDRLSDQASEFALAHLTPISHSANSCKNDENN